MRLTHIRDLDVEAPLASGHSFLSAASGLVRLGETLYAVADDDLHLARFQGAAPGKLMRLLPGDLPHDAAARKKAKPDFEMLLSVGEDRLLAMGSGSKKKRKRGVLVEQSSGQVAPVDLKPLFDAVEPLVPETNLEGAVIDGDRLLLFNRGNMAEPVTQIIETSLSDLLTGKSMEAKLAQALQLPERQGVPLTATDACRLEDGHILLSAVSEVTDNSYADGALTGAALVLLDADLRVVALEDAEPLVKIEGIAAQRTTEGIEILCVTDADEPDQPAGLYRALWQI
jgi:hypothetical protein